MAFNFGAPSGTSGTSAATAAPAGESAPGPPSKARKPWARPLGPIPPGWGSGVAPARGTPWGHLERVGGGGRGGGGRAAGCSGSAWGSHDARIPRGPVAGWLPATGDSARERPAGGDAPLPSRDPVTPRTARPPGPGASLRPLPSPGDAGPCPWCPSLLSLSPPPRLSQPVPVPVRFIHAVKPLADSCNSYLAFFSFSLPPPLTFSNFCFSASTSIRIWWA